MKKNLRGICEELGLGLRTTRKTRFESDHVVTFGTTPFTCDVYVIEPCNVLGYRTYRVSTKYKGEHHFVDLHGDGSTTITYKKLTAILRSVKMKAYENEGFE